MQTPGEWIPLRRPNGRYLTRAAARLKSYNNYIEFYHDHGPVWGDPNATVYCVKWSQDDSFYCCPKDYQNHPASGWRKDYEAIKLFDRRKANQIEFSF